MNMRVTRQQMEQMICYEDAEVIVVHKPPFLAVETRDLRQQDLVSLLKNRRVAKGEPAFIGIVHRLDQPVEGLLVLAKTKEAAARLSEGLRKGDFAKEYLAVVSGVTEESGTLIHTLKKDGRTNTSAVVAKGTAGGKEARLCYERLAVMDEKSLVRIRLETGRHHQIRVQFSAAGHPLVGDAKYGDNVYVCRDEIAKKAKKYDKTGISCGARTDGMKQPLALCSCRLVFAHPCTGEEMEFHTTPTGAGFDEWKKALG